MLMRTAFFCLPVLVLTSFSLSQEGSRDIRIDSLPAKQSLENTGVHTGKTFVLLIGINKYPPAISSLEYCVQDVEGLAESLKKSGVPENHIVLMTDDAARIEFRPSKTNIEHQIEAIAKRTRENDQLILAFSGHGATVAGSKHYLCPNDTNFDDIETLISKDRIDDILERCSAKRKLFILDACRNEVAVRGSRSLGGVKSLADPLGNKETQGFVTLASCSKGQRSWEDPNIGHGVFTYYVMKGLEGEADHNPINGNQDGIITLQELYAYTMDNTRRHVRKLRNVAQLPTRIGEMSGTFTLLKYDRLKPLRDKIVPDYEAMLVAVNQNNPAKDYFDEHDDDKLSLWREGAEKGIAEAQVLYGECLEKGVGQSEDVRLAAEYYRKAALQGNEQALKRLRRSEKGFIAENTYAVLIGIDEYRHFPSLKCCASDVITLAESLKSRGIPSKNLILLTHGHTDPRYHPKKENIERLLEKASSSRKEDQQFIVVFSGLGSASGLCPADASGDDPASMVSWKWIGEKLEQSAALRKLLIVDAGYVPPESFGETLDFFTLLSACSEGQTSYVTENEEHSIFFRGLIEGMETRANAKDAESLTLEAFYKEVLEKTGRHVPKRWSKSLGHTVQNTQTPLLKGACRLPLVIPDNNFVQTQIRMRKICDKIIKGVENIFTGIFFTIPEPSLHDLLNTPPTSFANAENFSKDFGISLEDIESGIQKNIPEALFIGSFLSFFSRSEKVDPKMLREAMKQGMPQASIIFFMLSFHNKELQEEAIRYLQQFASAHYAPAQSLIGFSLLFTATEDKENAKTQTVEWFQKAAEQNYPPAQYAMGCFYSEKFFLAKADFEKDDKIAADWFRKAAEQDCMTAQWALADAYENGSGIDLNLREAVKWYRKAAEQNLADAQYNLGLCYETGKGVEKNIVDASAWYAKASASGHKDAKGALEKIEAAKTQAADTSPQ